MSTYSVDTSALTERPTIYNTLQYNVAEILMPNVPNVVASGAGATVVVAVVFDTTTAFVPNLPIDTHYNIEVCPSQACAVSYSAKTTAGFTVTLTPLTSGVTLAIGTIDVRVTFPNGGVN